MVGFLKQIIPRFSDLQFYAPTINTVAVYLLWVRYYSMPSIEVYSDYATHCCCLSSALWFGVATSDDPIHGYLSWHWFYAHTDATLPFSPGLKAELRINPSVVWWVPCTEPGYGGESVGSCSWVTRRRSDYKLTFNLHPTSMWHLTQLGRSYRFSLKNRTKQQHFLHK